jgi:hypothetical protein
VEAGPVFDEVFGMESALLGAVKLKCVGEYGPFDKCAAGGGGRLGKTAFELPRNRLSFAEAEVEKDGARNALLLFGTGPKETGNIVYGRVL